MSRSMWFVKVVATTTAVCGLLLGACDCDGASPIADAGEDKSGAVGQVVVLDGSKSSDPEGGPLSYAWRLLETPRGSTPALRLPEGPQPQLVADVEGKYTLELVVTGAGGVSAPDRVLVTIACGLGAPEVAASFAAGDSGPVGVPVGVAATVTDPDEVEPCALDQAHTLAWELTSVPAGSAARFADPTLTSPSFVPDLAGTYEITVRATDDRGVTGAATITYTAGCGDTAPVVESATVSDGAPDLFEQVTFSSTFTDADNEDACGRAQQLTPAWRIASRPAGSTAALVGADTATPRFSPDLAGAYAFELIVTDDTGRQSAPASVSITVGGCGVAAPVALIAQTAPVVSAASPDLQLDEVITCAGAVNLQLDASDSFDPDETDGCAAGPLFYRWTIVDAPAGGTADVYEGERINPSFAFDASGSYAVELIVTDATGRESAPARATIDVVLVDPPVVTDVAPDFFCPVQGGTAMTITGTFATIDGAQPTAIVGGLELAGTAGGCTAVQGLAADVQTCATLDVVVPGTIDASEHTVRVRNPFPANCTSLDGAPVLVAGAPSLDAFSPSPICRRQFDGTLTLQGSGYFQDTASGTVPTITVNGVPVPASDIQMQTCADTVVPNLQMCDAMQVVVPLSQRDLDMTFAVTNPAPADCQTATAVFQLNETPLVQDVQPRKICHLGGSLDLFGDFFEQGMGVDLGGVAASTVVVDSAQSATATWSTSLQPGLHDLTATNPSGCAETFPTQIRVTDGPIVFFVDPVTLYNGISLTATIFVGNLFGGSVTKVELVGPQDQPADQQVATDLAFTFDPTRPNRLQAVVPAGLAEGLYGVRVTDDVGCPRTTDGLVTVTGEVVLALEQIEPPFVQAGDTTGVAVTNAATTPFSPTPRAYLSPTAATCAAAGAAQCLATELRATTMVSGTQLNGVVDAATANLAVGAYDVVVVNPDGSVGVLLGAFQVTAEAPPVVTSVSPGSWETGVAALPVALAGSGFRTGATVSVECKDANGNIDVGVVGSVTVVDDANATISVDTSTLDHLSACVLRLTNTDTTYVDFSPITVTNPAGNFVSFKKSGACDDGTQCNVDGQCTGIGGGACNEHTLSIARRAPAVIGGGRTARFLYTIGGDQGAASSALSSIEVSALDRFGEPGAWSTSRSALPSGRTQAKAARLRDFIYLVGGHDGTSPTTDVLRANVLDPLFVPVIDDVDLVIDEAGGPGVAPGVYYYVVSAVMAADDAANPGGETLASDPQPIRVPVLATGTIRVALGWKAVPNAAGYRVYRSPTPNLTFGSEQLLAVRGADERSIVDDGQTATDPAQTPLPPGSLGTWHRFATLGSARADAGVAIARDPTTADRFHLYAVGGHVAGQPSKSYDVVSIALGGARAQSLVGVQSPGDVLTVAKAELEAVVADATNANSITDGRSYLYVLGGKSLPQQGVAQPETVAEAAQIQAGGLLGAFTQTVKMSPFRAGYAAAVANSTIVVVGGQSGAPNASGNKNEICGNACAVPTQLLGNSWSALGGINMRDRYLMGRASEGGFLYLVGGLTAGSVPSDTIDFSILGGTP